MKKKCVLKTMVLPDLTKVDFTDDCINIYSDDMANLYITGNEMLKCQELGQRVTTEQSLVILNGKSFHKIQMCVFDNDVNLKVWSIKNGCLLAWQNEKQKNKVK